VSVCVCERERAYPLGGEAPLVVSTKMYGGVREGGRDGGRERKKE